MADDLDRIEEAVVRLVRGSASPKVQSAISLAVGAPVERSTYVLLRALAPSAELSVSVLAAAVGLDASTVSRQVTSLERQGLVRRSDVPGDRRRSNVAITDAGVELLRKIQAARHELFGEVLSDWLPQDLATLAPLLERLALDLFDHGGTA